MPRLNRIQEAYAARGLAVLAVNFGDKVNTVADYFDRERFKLVPVRQAKDEVSRAFGVRVYPTLILIDTEGIVVWRSVTFDEEELKAALDRVAGPK